MSVNLDKFSLVVWYQDVEKHRCGYCKNPKGSISNGMWADSLTVEEYQMLIDRGWRRSGKYCYKPIMDETCCPQYTIKCDAMNISLTKSQKKIIKKINKFLNDGILNKKDVPPEAQNTAESSDITIRQPDFIINKSAINSEPIETENNLLGTGEPDHSSLKCKISVTQKNPVSGESGLSQDKHVTLKTSHKEGVGVDHSKPPCKKAKIMRIERKKEKLMKMGLDFQKQDSLSKQKSIEEFLEEIPESSKMKLKLRLIPTSQPNSQWESVQHIEFELYKKYQMIVHNDPAEKLSMKGFKRFLVNSPLEITLERMSETNENFLASARLFTKYQMSVHNEPPCECDEDVFESFLVRTPLKPEDFPNNDGPGFGSFHQQYWLDDVLIAVGVIDILPRSVSSVYFFYDPDYRNLTLGTYGSLREIQFTRSLQKKVPELCNYYMGFYIHSCPKMRYKGKWSPSYLLCPETYAWIPIEKCIVLLDANKYSRLNEDIDALDERLPSDGDLNTVTVVYNNILMRFKTFEKQYPDGKVLFNKIGILVGRECLNRLVFWFG